MLRNVPPRKNGPPSTWERTTSPKTVRYHRSTHGRRKQPPPCEGRKVRTTSEQPRDGFWCAWCGHPHPWSEMAGWDGRLKFCETCVRVMDAIEIGTVGPTNSRRRSA